MRTELYNRIKNALLNDLTGEQIKHVDLWNQNVQFIDQEAAWPMPAVFIEFMPIAYEQVRNGAPRCHSTINLHVVTDWTVQSAAEIFILCDMIADVLDGSTGTRYHHLIRTGSVTNHNHEEIVESVETYAFIGTL